MNQIRRMFLNGRSGSWMLVMGTARLFLRCLRCDYSAPLPPPPSDTRANEMPNNTALIDAYSRSHESVCQFRPFH